MLQAFGWGAFTFASALGACALVTPSETALNASYAASRILTFTATGAALGTATVGLGALISNRR